MDPFAVFGPTMISFSGGRTSAYMLYRILQAHGGHLPADVHVAFSNTGKERKETLEFVQKCAEAWQVKIHWIEAIFQKPFFRDVDFASASRAGEPFAALIEKKKALPNAIARFCTQELKIIPMARWMRAQGYDEWTVLVGLRYDEPSRVARIRAPSKERFLREAPLHQAKITKSDVMAFWKTQAFDLRLKPYESNCDLCFLKGSRKRLEILRTDSSLADWWIEQEQRRGATFVKPAREPGGYQGLKKIVHHLPLLPGLNLDDEDDSLDCACTDLGLDRFRWPC